MTALAEQITVTETPLPQGLMIRPSVPIAPEVQTSATAQAIIETAQDFTIGSKLVIDAVKNAAIATGRWIGRHPIGVSYATSGALGLLAAYNITKGVYDADYYNTISDSINIVLGTEVPKRPERDTTSDNIAIGGVSSVLSMTAGVLGLALRDHKRERSEL